MKPTYEKFEYISLDELSKDLDRLKHSEDYQRNKGDPDHFLVQEVARLELMAPGLSRFETLKAQIREDKLRVAELEQIYKATCENLGRLRHQERNLLDDSMVRGS